MKKRRIWIGALALVTPLAVACWGTLDKSEQTSRSVEAVVTQGFILPVPVGSSPQELTLGAAGFILVGDYASVLGPRGGDIAAIGLSGTTDIGILADVHNVWSRATLNLRQSKLNFYKTQGVVTQTGATFSDPDENRSGIIIRPDPIWTVSLSAPTSGTDITVPAGQTTSLAAGNYGNVTVSPGGTLNLTGRNYGFVSLDVQAIGTTRGSVVMADIAPVVTVNLALTLKGSVQKTGLVLAYLGSNPLSVEGPLVTDLLLAPNATINIKYDVIGHFFGQNVTLANNHRVAGPTLTQSVLDFINPTDAVAQPVGLFAAQAGMGEIGSALMGSGMNPLCSGTQAFVSYTGASMIQRNVADIGTTAPFAVSHFPDPQPPPSACLSTWLPANNPAWLIKPGGTPNYSDGDPDKAFTDNLMTRMSGGRVVSVGFSGRWCTDPTAGITQFPNCPASKPTDGSSCNPDPLNNRACIYGTTQSQCRPHCDTACGPASCEEYQGGLEGARCNSAGNCTSGVCSIPTGATMGTCTRQPDGTVTKWVSGPLKRLDAGMLSVRMTTDCGSSWTAGAYDPSSLGARTSDGMLIRILDRPEVFWDNFDERLYVNATGYAGGGGAGSPYYHNFIFSASTANLTNANNLTWQAPQPQPVVSSDGSDHNNDNGYLRPMTTVLDERARLNTTPASFGRYVHLVTTRCYGTEAEVQVYTPFGRKTWALAEGDTDPSTACQNPEPGDNGQPFGGLKAGPTIVGVSSVPPRVLIAYVGIAGTGSTRRSVINIYSVMLRSSLNYSQRPTIYREQQIDVSGHHSIFPQLIGPDGLGVSDRQGDTPVVLRWTDVSGDTVTEKAQVIYSGVRSLPRSIATWSLSATFPGGPCAPGVWVGDYKYGGFFRKLNGKLSYFTPWTGGGLAAGSSTPINYVGASGAFIEVTP